jgi:hypothetical protein
MTLAVWVLLVRRPAGKSGQASPVTVRPATEADIAQVIAVDQAVWGGICPASEAMFRSRIRTFPEGGLVVAEVEGRIVAFTSVQYLADLAAIHSSVTWQAITDGGTISGSHAPAGDWVYGVGLACTSQGSRCQAAQQLMLYIGELAVKKRKRGILLVARTASYERYRSRFTPEAYVLARRRNGLPLDAELYLYARASLRVRRPPVVIKDYMEPGSDPKAAGFGVVVEWRSPFYYLPFSPYWAPALIQRFIR